LVTTDIGNRFILAILASASYIAVPVQWNSVPKAIRFVPMALAVTFSFNITLGMPIYISIIMYC
jgi:hypothetical protein